ncbi:hypothetical protein DPEC_G00119370 [Dallia pectoralis]|uniref:Uncharacterized protein n=1 Tax=Dallia pectoralis TaxID=75939 RepID=A0ACC2GPK1_DALPE|nr:hypothetical protein DPEC_G00119370 [Dallia pectoralis]
MPALTLTNDLGGSRQQGTGQSCAPSQGITLLLYQAGSGAEKGLVFLSMGGSVPPDLSECPVTAALLP